MRVTYLAHSGFLIETTTSYYLFDYYQGELPTLNCHLPIVVFCSHSHRDHYQPKIFALLQSLGMTQIFGVLAKDISKRRYPEGIEILRAYANQTYSLPQGEILETLLSTDSGVAYLLTTTEGVIYHAGDLNDWTWDGEPEEENRMMRGNYRHEIDKLKGRSIDLAFLPLDPRQEGDYAAGMCYFLKKIQPKIVYPMHYWDEPNIIQQFLQEFPEYENVVQNTEESRKGKTYAFSNDTREL